MLHTEFERRKTGLLDVSVRLLDPGTVAQPAAIKASRRWEVAAAAIVASFSAL